LKLSANWYVVFLVIDMTLLETRKQYNVSQAKVASFLGIPVRTYIRYEKDDSYYAKKAIDDILAIVHIDGFFIFFITARGHNLIKNKS
jgi:transcriptional regulator with XRE-family HTH domain